MNIYSTLAKSIYLSPGYVIQVACGAAVLANGLSDNSSSVNSTSRVLCGGMMIAPALSMFPANFSKYRRVVALIQKYGYQDRLLSAYLKSFCGRRQLKLACKEFDLLNRYHEHIKKEGIKWHHFDPNPILNLFHPFAVVINIPLGLFNIRMLYERSKKQNS